MGQFLAIQQGEAILWSMLADQVRAQQPPICPSALPVFHFDVCHSLPTNQAKDQSALSRNL